MKIKAMLILACIGIILFLLPSLIGSGRLIDPGNFVPYSGATSNVDLGIYNLSIGDFLFIGSDGILEYQVGNTFRFNHGLYIGGANGFLDVATKLLVGGYAKFDDDVNITKNLNVFDTSYFNGSLMPMTTLTWDIGSGAKRWRVGYFQNISSDYINNAYTITTGGLTAGSMNVTYMNVTRMDVVSFNVTTINASYIYNPYFPGAMDLRGDPWYISGTDLQIAQNLLVDGNITAEWVTLNNLNVTDTAFFNRLSNVGELIMSGIIFSQNITPLTSGLYSIGNSTNWFDELFAENIYAELVNTTYLNSSEIYSNIINSENITSEDINTTNMTIGGFEIYKDGEDNLNINLG